MLRETLYFNLTFLIIGAFVVLGILAIRSGIKYTKEDVDEDAVSYAGIIAEGEGGMTTFLWISYIIMFVWTLVYLYIHWNEFI